VPILIGRRGDTAKLKMPVDAVVALQSFHEVEPAAILRDVLRRQRREVTREHGRNAHQPTANLAILESRRKAAADVHGVGCVVFDGFERQTAVLIQTLARVPCSGTQLLPQFLDVCRTILANPAPL
jgi:hypothetical protein